MRQNIKGKYVRRNIFHTTFMLMILGSLSTLLAFISFSTFLNVTTSTIKYSKNTKTQLFLPKGYLNFYIEVDNFHQNNLAYSKSINYKQLSGEIKDLNLSSCSPYDYYYGKPYYPAGAVANTYFQDVINIEGLKIETENIAWNKEIDLIGYTKYNPSQIAIPDLWTPFTNVGTVPLNTDQEGLPILNERFVNWIYLSAFSDFRKLWGYVRVPYSGNYNVEVESMFDFCDKSIVFSQRSWLGSKNLYLSYGLLTVGILCIVGSIVLRKLPAYEM